MKPAFDIIGRLAITGTTVAAVGFAFVTLYPFVEEGETTLGVQESSADIFGFSFAERTSTQKFQAALEHLGHEKPRVYDLNGNTVMFSMNQKRGSIDEVAAEYLRGFADEGLNPHIFDPYVENGSPEHKAMLDAGIKGGVLPWVINDDYMSMGGGVMDTVSATDVDMVERVTDQNDEFTQLLDRLEHGYRSCGGDAKAYKTALLNPREVQTIGSKTKVEKTMTSLCEGGAAPAGTCDTVVYQQRENQRRYSGLIQVIEDQDLLGCGPVRDGITAFAGMRYDDFTGRVKAFRSIEAWHNKKTNMTKITATWSDEDFDMKKTQPSRYGGVIRTEAAEKVPLCPGCRRTWAFQGTGNERAYSSNMIISPSDTTRTMSYYMTEMTNDGWEIPEADLVVEEMKRMHGKQDADNRWVRFRRGNENLAMNFTRDEAGRTRVRTAASP